MQYLRQHSKFLVNERLCIYESFRSHRRFPSWGSCNRAYHRYIFPWIGRNSRHGILCYRNNLSGWRNTDLAKSWLRGSLAKRYVETNHTGYNFHSFRRSGCFVEVFSQYPWFAQEVIISLIRNIPWANEPPFFTSIIKWQGINAWMPPGLNIYPNSFLID